MSIAQQNIERELRVLRKVEKAKRVPVAHYESITLANTNTPSSRLDVDLTTSPSFRTVSLEHLAVHGLHTSGPGADTVRVTVGCTNGFSVSRDVGLPRGRHTLEEFARLLEVNMNRGRVNDPSSRMFQATVTFAPPLKFVGIFRHRETNDEPPVQVIPFHGRLPLAEVWNHVFGAPTASHALTSITTDGFAVARMEDINQYYLSPDSTRPGILFPRQEDNYSQTDSHVSMRVDTIPKYENGTLVGVEPPVYFPIFDVTEDMLVPTPENDHTGATTAAALPPEKRGLYEFCYLVRPEDKLAPEMPAKFYHWPVPVFLAILKGWSTNPVGVYVVFYNTSKGRVIRVTCPSVREETSVRPPLVECAFFDVPLGNTIGPHMPTSAASNESAQRWPWLHVDENVMGYGWGYRFWVSTAGQLAELIETSKPAPIYVSQADEVNIYNTLAWMDRVHPATAILASTYTDAVLSPDPPPSLHSYIMLLHDIQSNPRRYTDKLRGRLIYAMIPRMATLRALDRFSMLQLSGVAKWSFNVTGPGARALGLRVNMGGVDPLARTPMVCDGRAVPVDVGWGAGFGIMHGTPISDAEGIEICPRRLFVYLSINNTRQLGNVHGLRPLAVVPTRKARYDLYEPATPIFMPVGNLGAITRIGVEIEDENGAPVTGEYTVMLRLK